jgi:hypothetical protein
MQKKTILIISLIISIFSLFYLIFDYYGYIRYVKLHLYDNNLYLKNYVLLPKLNKERIVICFTTTSDNIKNIKPFINSILDQTLRVDEIILILPYDDQKNVPDNIKKILSVQGYKKKYNSSPNVICSVLTEPEATTKIILVEPSIIYSQDFVENMVEASNKNPDKIIYSSNTKQTKYGILIKPKFFDDKISKYEETCSNTDFLDKCTNNPIFISNSGNILPIWKFN